MKNNPNPSFILGTGRSGTLWLATALRKAAGLDARHESLHQWDGTLPFGEVEVNSFFWADSLLIRERLPGVRLVHLVRDGRDVVRSAMSRPRPGRTFLKMCRLWAIRNDHLRQMVGKVQCYRLEDLTSDYAVFAVLASYLGGRPNRLAWSEVRAQRINATEDGEHLWPPYKRWAEAERKVFWDICGPGMELYGYDER